MEYVSYHHRGVTRHLLPIHNARSRCGSHFEYILARGELSPKRFDFPFKGSYIYTCWGGRGGRGGKVSIEESAGGWWCLKILAGCHHPAAPSSSPLTPSRVRRIYIYTHTPPLLPREAVSPFSFGAYVSGCISGVGSYLFP